MIDWFYITTIEVNIFDRIVAKYNLCNSSDYKIMVPTHGANMKADWIRGGLEIHYTQCTVVFRDKQTCEYVETIYHMMKAEELDIVRAA